jgi:hypothetical protein
MTNGTSIPGGDREEFAGARSYAVPFSDVWSTALAAVAELRGWRVLTSNSQAGTVQLATADRFGRRPLDAELRLSLDEVGLTRLEMRMGQGRRLLLPAAAPGRVARLLGRVDRLLRGGAPG